MRYFEHAQRQYDIEKCVTSGVIDKYQKEIAAENDNEDKPHWKFKKKQIPMKRRGQRKLEIDGWHGAELYNPRRP